MHVAAALLFGPLIAAAPQGDGVPNARPAAAPQEKPKQPRQDDAPRIVQEGAVEQAIVEEVVFRGSKRMTEEALRLRVRTQKGKP